MNRDVHVETVNREKARLHDAARADLAKLRKKYKVLFDKYHALRREHEACSADIQTSEREGSS